MGIKKNILYTAVLTTSNYIFPLITYPYVSRVLGVTNIGLCNFIDSVINYFILFSMMGMSIIGTRQIAIDKSKDLSIDPAFSSLLFINGLFTFLSLGVLIVLTFVVPELSENKELMWYGALKLVSNFLLIEWFYKGLEDFKFITIRSLILKCLFVASIFIFVREREDYPIYYLLTVLMITGNAIINILYSRKFARFKFKLINLLNVYKPFFILGGYFILTSLYTTFNTVFLGFTTNDTQVGYYTTATKLYSILLALYTGVTTVLMPRMSNLLAQNKIDEFKVLISKSTTLLFQLSIPLIILCDVFTPQIIMLISGPGYEGAITPMRIIMPLMLIIGYEQIQVVQCLMPLGKDKTIMINASIGAIIGIILNLTIVPHLQSIGSAITWACAELSILILSQYYLKKYLNINFPVTKLCKEILSYIPLTGILIAIYFIFSFLPYWVILLIGCGISGVYFILLMLRSNEHNELKSLFQGIRNKF